MGIVARMAGSVAIVTRSVRARGMVAVLVCAPVPLLAQGARALMGTVRDSAGQAVAGAEVRGRGALLALTNDSGFFRTTALPAGAQGLVVRRLGFAPVLVPLATGGDSVVVSLTAIPAVLPSVRVQQERDLLSHKVLSGFWARRARGFGKFITREEIEEREPIDFVDIVRRIPSVKVQMFRGRQEVRFNRNAGRDCPPQYWVDGIPIEQGSAAEFAPENVEALELYASPATTPPQFTRGAGVCGAVVVWTRLPG